MDGGFLPKTLALAKGGNSSDWLHTFLCNCQRFWWSFRKSLYLFHTIIYRWEKGWWIKTWRLEYRNQEDTAFLFKSSMAVLCNSEISKSSELIMTGERRQNFDDRGKTYFQMQVQFTKCFIYTLKYTAPNRSTTDCWRKLRVSLTHKHAVIDIMHAALAQDLVKLWENMQAVHRACSENK